MKIIPVIDLMQGQVVRAAGGVRSAYRPWLSPLCPDADPLALIDRLVAGYAADTLYIADLDAITGNGDNLRRINAIAARFPGLTLWVDAGIHRPDALSDCLERHPWRPVIGSETLRDCRLLTHPEAHRTLLSLDFQGHRLLGPAELQERRELWPRDLILMSLRQVGAGSGPDLARLRYYRELLPSSRLYSAGGVGGPADLLQLRRHGAAGVLLASALHAGRIRPADLAPAGHDE